MMMTTTTKIDNRGRLWSCRPVFLHARIPTTTVVCQQFCRTCA